MESNQSRRACKNNNRWFKHKNGGKEFLFWKILNIREKSREDQVNRSENLLEYIKNFGFIRTSAGKG